MSQAANKVGELEEKVLKYSGLQLHKDLHVYDVPIELQGKNYKIHTYRCGDQNKESIVLLHGYAGSSALYYPMLKKLSQNFRVYCIDFIGMGLSSKEKFECKSTEETIDFLVGSVDKWRQAEGLQSFHLAGHSFGGYISGQYAMTHQNQVKKLTLLSPVGVTRHEEEVRAEDIRKRLGFFKGMFFDYFMKVWENKITPVSFCKNHPWIARYIIKRYVHNKFHLKDEEAEALKEFLVRMLSLPQGSEEAIHYILKPPLASAYLPLEDIIAQKLKMPVDCYFGQYDYMDTTGARRLHTLQKKWNYNFRVVPDADHQVTMQNPGFLSDEITKGVFAN